MFAINSFSTCRYFDNLFSYKVIAMEETPVDQEMGSNPLVVEPHPQQRQGPVLDSGGSEGTSKVTIIIKVIGWIGCVTFVALFVTFLVLVAISNVDLVMHMCKKFALEILICLMISTILLVAFFGAHAKKNKKATGKLTLGDSENTGKMELEESKKSKSSEKLKKLKQSEVIQPEALIGSSENITELEWSKSGILCISIAPMPIIFMLIRLLVYLSISSDKKKIDEHYTRKLIGKRPINRTI